jgi:D-arginine dehydrogenase
LAGVGPLGITPYRRTVAQLRTSPPVPACLPLVLDLREGFYFKPESGRLWLSPHDETPSPPCDAAPEEIDVALAIDRLREVPDWSVDRVEHRWAGLRSFAPDRLPVYGFDSRRSGFFWFAGQGGFGIQTAPAAADLATELLLGRRGGQIEPEPYSPARFG